MQGLVLLGARQPGEEHTCLENQSCQTSPVFAHIVYVRGDEKPVEYELDRAVKMMGCCLSWAMESKCWGLWRRILSAHERDVGKDGANVRANSNAQ